MSIEDGPNPARRAVEEMLHVVEHGRDLCPPDRDPRVWASGVLDDLARVAELLDDAVGHVSGRHNDAVAGNARALASCIAAHRNIEVGPPAR